MRQKAINQMTTSELVEKFVEVAVAQDEAELRGQMAKYNRLFKQMMDVEGQLRGRDGDQRLQLLRLFDHPNLHVRVQAAMLTLAVAPVEARAQLEILAASDRLPYSADAGMCLWNLDRGVFKPT
jgi:hypothetical protein